MGSSTLIPNPLLSCCQISVDCASCKFMSNFDMLAVGSSAPLSFNFWVLSLPCFCVVPGIGLTVVVRLVGDGIAVPLCCSKCQHPACCAFVSFSMRVLGILCLCVVPHVSTWFSMPSCHLTCRLCASCHSTWQHWVVNIFTLSDTSGLGSPDVYEGDMDSFGSFDEWGMVVSWRGCVGIEGVLKLSKVVWKR